MKKDSSEGYLPEKLYRKILNSIPICCVDALF